MNIQTFSSLKLWLQIKFAFFSFMYFKRQIKYFQLIFIHEFLVLFESKMEVYFSLIEKSTVTIIIVDQKFKFTPHFQA